MRNAKLLHLMSICLFALFATSAVVDAAKKNDEGDLWTYTISNGKKEHTGNFRVRNLDIYKDDKKVGRVVADDPENFSITFTDLKDMNGKAHVHKTKNGVATGTLKKADGTEWEMKVHFK